MQLIVHSRTRLADGILALELVAPDGAALPAFAAGAHIELQLAPELARSYSLANDPAERHRYVVAVQKDANGRGGSAWVHEHLRDGQCVRVDGPRNNFALVETAPDSVLVAGGIGITPLYCMIQRLEAIGKPWKLLYAARSRGNAAYLAEIKALEANRPGRVQLHFNDERNGRVPDLAAIVAAATQGAHLYCCGPTPMLDAFLAATKHLPEGNAHVEFFSAAHEAATDGGYVVELSRSGRRFTIPAGKTILSVLRDAKVDVDYSCEEGTCGACETRVLEGDIDHRDSYLTASEQRSGKKMMICCSGCRGGKLVLDL